MPGGKLQQEVIKANAARVEATPELRAIHEKNMRQAVVLKDEEKADGHLPVEFKNPSIDEFLDKGCIYDAQALYFRHTPIAEIHRITGVPISAIRRFVYADPGGWKIQRELLHSEVKEEIKHTALKALREVTQINLSLIGRALKNFQKDIDSTGLEPTMDQAYMLTDIFSKLHKAKIAEESDDVKELLGTMTPEEALDALTSDPYMKKAIAARVQEQTVPLPDDSFYEVEEKDAESNSDSGSIANPNR
jgi:hypothetical protein